MKHLVRQCFDGDIHRLADLHQRDIALVELELQPERAEVSDRVRLIADIDIAALKDFLADNDAADR
jgi:hypothetical protein